MKGLKASMVIGPSEVSKNEYDVLIVDEAHRLRKRKTLPTLKVLTMPINCWDLISTKEQNWIGF